MKSKKQKKRTRKEFLSPLYIPPARKKVLDGPVLKIIQYKYEFNLDWYLLTFKDPRKQPEWQQYRNLEGCNDMIKDFWIREEAGTTPMVGPFGSSKFLRFSKRKIKKSNYSLKLNENDNIVYLKEFNRSMHNSPLTQIQENAYSQTIRPIQMVCKSKATGILNMNNEWIGSLEKGQNKKFLATVLLKPYNEPCHDVSSL
ncbi:hypothetical protein C2G38_703565 [Gigaspora rosea]|uniref:Uncharacterized protein n=1 Tax=Gigaspora rosea TaxID=44941 RepID=A0A397U4X3_9GLOM|nr:hypothetical protein C2G38_703565 [Gigaspora rosea]